MLLCLHFVGAGAFSGGEEVALHAPGGTPVRTTAFGPMFRAT